MTLAAGTKLGPYEILSLLGAGGMGEVYRARDTRLGRDVAIKVLPHHLSSNPEVRARFGREAKTVSSLNHPHICVLHDVGREGDTDYLVMELIEGETLATRIAKGPVPMAEVLKLGAQIADALDRAHRASVVHRDLKPGNIMLTKSGAKLMDFGLARAMGLAGPGSGSEVAMATLTQSPTVAQPLTAEGTILGTFQYMAPEQLEGKEADARSDIWAFGCVLYEMLTGKRAFEGKSQASLIAAILDRQPPAISSLQPTSPPTLDRIVRRCLEKDPEDRWQNAQDLAIELRWIGEDESHATAAPVAARPAPRRRVWKSAAIGIAGVVLGAVLAKGTWLLGMNRVRDTRAVRAVVLLPPGQNLPTGARRPIAISRDGRLLAYVGVTAQGSRVFVRSLDKFESTPVGGTEGGQGPFFSPDGLWLGYFAPAEGQLKKVALSGGAPVVICEAPDVRGASWGPDDMIVFAAQLDGGLVRVPAGGGVAQALTTPDASRHEKTHRFPDVLPNGKAVLFTIGTHDITSFADARIALHETATGQTRVLIEGGSDARYLSPGYLVYGRGGEIMAAPFDADRLQITGPSVPVVDGVLTSSLYGWAAFGTSPDGVLAYVEGVEPLDVDQLTWVDRAGRATPLGVDKKLFLAARLSPTGDRVAVRVSGANDTLWIADLRRGNSFSRLTFRGNVASEVWTPDGRRVLYNIGNEIASIAADGSGDDQTVFRDEYTNIPSSISPDGETLIFSTNRPETGWDIWALSMKERKAHPVLSAPFSERYARLSPDGRWIAYVSNESGREEIYVRPFPGLGTKWPISRDGGTMPIWSQNGRELFFRRGDDVMAVEVGTAGADFSAAVPRKLFAVRTRLSADSYDLAPDGQRFITISTNPPPLPSSMDLVLGWLEELKLRVPSEK